MIAAAVVIAMVVGGAALIRFAGGGATEFRLTGAEMHIRGPITGASAERFERLLEEAEGLEVVVLRDIPGADDAGWLIQMATFIRAAGLATRAEGDLNNDAILLFLAGASRDHVAGDLTITGAEAARRQGWTFDASPAGRTERASFATRMLGSEDFAAFVQERRALGGTYVLNADDIERFGLETGE
ncbi:hypothetical protein [Gymnodinialimonas sp.]